MSPLKEILAANKAGRQDGSVPLFSGDRLKELAQKCEASGAKLEIPKAVFMQGRFVTVGSK